jgi:uncharacterized membrane protein YphA (DoxX/SURF4 family)
VIGGRWPKARRFDFGENWFFYTTFAELFGGALLLLGWQRKWTYRVLAVVLLVVSFGHGLESPIWDLQHVIFRTILLVTLFFLPEEWDLWSLDRRLMRSRA